MINQKELQKKLKILFADIHRRMLMSWKFDGYEIWKAENPELADVLDRAGLTPQSSLGRGVSGAEASSRNMMFGRPGNVFCDEYHMVIEVPRGIGIRTVNRPNMRRAMGSESVVITPAPNGAEAIAHMAALALRIKCSKLVPAFGCPYETPEFVSTCTSLPPRSALYVRRANPYYGAIKEWGEWFAERLIKLLVMYETLAIGLGQCNTVGQAKYLWPNVEMVLCSEDKDDLKCRPTRIQGMILSEVDKIKQAGADASATLPAALLSKICNDDLMALTANFIKFADSHDSAVSLPIGV